jgi:hypothetical protein
VKLEKSFIFEQCTSPTNALGDRIDFYPNVILVVQPTPMLWTVSMTGAELKQSSLRPQIEMMAPLVTKTTPTVQNIANQKGMH